GGQYTGPGGSFPNGFGTVFRFGLDGSGGTCFSANGDDLLQPNNSLIVSGGGFIGSTGQSFTNPGFVLTLSDCRAYIPRRGDIPSTIGSGPSGTLLNNGTSDEYGVVNSSPGGSGALYRFDRMRFELLHSFTGEPGKTSNDGCRPQVTPKEFGGRVFGTTRFCG